MIFFLVVPMTKKVYQRKDSLEEAKLILKRDQENTDKYKKDLEYLGQNSFLSEGLLINENNRVLLIEDLEKIASEKNLEMKMEMYSPSVVARKTKKDETAAKTLLKLSLTGEYDDFLVFVYKLQNFKYVVSIDTLTVERFDDSKIKNLKGEIILEDLPEIEGEIVVSFNEQKL
jgi:hypothetical protein